MLPKSRLVYSATALFAVDFIAAFLWLDWRVRVFVPCVRINRPRFAPGARSAHADFLHNLAVERCLNRWALSANFAGCGVIWRVGIKRERAHDAAPSSNRRLSISASLARWNAMFDAV